MEAAALVFMLLGTWNCCHSLFMIKIIGTFSDQERAFRIAKTLFYRQFKFVLIYNYLFQA
jgi:hypothetical protein